MTSNANAKLNSQTAKVASSPIAPNGNTHPASVPISLYREVATELQSTRTSLESLKSQNQELVQKNQQLRLEIERVVQTALHLRQLADAQPANQLLDLEMFSAAERDLPVATTVAAPPVSEPIKEHSKPAGDRPRRLFTGQDSKPRAIAQPEATGEVGTWWLVLVICLIVVTAFGTGFFFVRPFLPSR